MIALQSQSEYGLGLAYRSPLKNMAWDLACSTAQASASMENDGSGTEDGNDDGPTETDQDRRQAMLDASQGAELDNLKYNYADDFDFDLPSLQWSQPACDMPLHGSMGSTYIGVGNKGTSYEDEGSFLHPCSALCTILLVVSVFHSSRFFASVKTAQIRPRTTCEKENVRDFYAWQHRARRGSVEKEGINRFGFDRESKVGRH